MTFVNDELQARFMTRIRGLDPLNRLGDRRAVCHRRHSDGPLLDYRRSTAGAARQ